MKSKHLKSISILTAVLALTFSYQNCSAPDASSPMVLGSEALCGSSEVEHQGQCFPRTLDCQIANGTGKQNFANGSYSNCEAQSCANNYHVENKSCLSNTQTCIVNNGSGQQMWNGSGYEPCTPTGCSINFHVENGNCTPDIKACAIANGTGEQIWNGTGYGDCELRTCDNSYVQRDNACIGPIHSTYRFFQRHASLLGFNESNRARIYDRES